MKLYAAPLDFRAIVAEYSVPTEFPEEVIQAARDAEDRFRGVRDDARDVGLVTIDPQGSMDLDQALCISQRGSGFRVYYAIADVAAFIEPGGPIEAESLRRGQTIYLPDEPARLHPAELSEDKASLLPGQDRPAILWSFDLDENGEVEAFSLRRSLVRSRERLDYDGVHADLLAGSLHPSIALLPQVGKLRQASSLRRNAISLRMPSQRVVEEDDGRFGLEIEPRYEIMDYNSEISLLTGMCAGQLMASRGVGFLRPLPGASPAAEKEFRAEIQALGFAMGQASISEFLLSIDADTPKGMAAMREAQRLLRGADYIWLAERSAEIHAGIGGYYAHVTAPLRRLSDRFAAEVCLALSTGSELPTWVSTRAHDVVAAMRASSHLAAQVDKACLNLTEATVLAPWVGSNFSAIVVHNNEKRQRSRLFVANPPVFAASIGTPEMGRETAVSLITADTATREVLFAWPAD